MAANSSSTDGLAVLKNTPQAFSETLCQFRVCHDLCVYSDNKILDEEMQTKIDQCAVNFRHMSLQTTTLSDQVASVWCRTCILFFKNMSKIKGDPSKVLKKISDQARDLSEGFKGIGNWCRKLAGDFHDVGKMGDEKSKKYKESMERTKKEAEETMKSLKADLDKAATEAEKERKRAKKWLIAAAIPVVNLVAGAGAIVTSQWASDAESLQRDAQRKSDEAKAELEKAASNSEKAEVRYYSLVPRPLSDKSRRVLVTRPYNALIVPEEFKQSRIHTC